MQGFLPGFLRSTTGLADIDEEAGDAEKAAEAGEVVEVGVCIPVTRQGRQKKKKSPTIANIETAPTNITKHCRTDTIKFDSGERRRVDR